LFSLSLFWGEYSKSSQILFSILSSRGSRRRDHSSQRLRNNVSEPLDRARIGCALLSAPHYKARIFRKNALKMFFVEHDHVVRTLAPRRTDQALNKAVLPGRAEGRRPIPNVHRSDASSEHGAKCSVIIANEILRCRVPRERFSDLARQPLGRRVRLDRAGGFCVPRGASVAGENRLRPFRPRGGGATCGFRKPQIRAYRWCSPPRIGCAIMSPNRSIGRVQGASLPSERCVRTSL
jgi:hypothetical protein